MTWQDLKDDLDHWQTAKGLARAEGRKLFEGPTIWVARRVLNLYQPCGKCQQGYVGYHEDTDEYEPCSRCGGTGVEPVDGFADLWSRNGLYYYQESAAALARYLFGEGEA